MAERPRHKRQLPASRSEQLPDSKRESTPARIFTGRPALAYPTAVQLTLRADHAAARDAVRAEWDLERALGRECVERFGLFTVSTRATSKHDYLLHPDRGRTLSDSGREEVLRRCPLDRDIQVVIGDGLSVAAVQAQLPDLLPRLSDELIARGWSVGQPFAVRYCRVGVMNDVGDLLRPQVIVLLIGERPGLATAESLSAYMAYRPTAGDTDARRNLISNIHARGTPVPEAARRIAHLAAQLLAQQASGTAVKEQLPPADPTGRIGPV